MKITVFCFISLISLSVFADDVDHFEGIKVNSVQQAQQILVDGNKTLSDLKNALNTQTITDIHELTYSMENAYAFLAEHHQQMAEALEALHLASEGYDQSTVKSAITNYLDHSQQN